MSITGTPASGPVRSGIPVGDLGGGVFGALGVLAALVSRSSTGLGKHVDVSMLDVQISLLNYMATMYLMSGHVPERLGNGHFVHVPYNTYRTQTHHIIIACIGDAFFKQLLDVFERPELRDERYLQQPARLADKALIDRVIEEELLTGSADHWLAKLRAARIPCAPVNSFAQALGDAQVKARNMVVEVQLQSGEVVQMPGNPIKFSDTTEGPFTAPPLLGEHTDVVLRDFLHYSSEQVDALRHRGVIQ
jgi:crotonobetainyl-CoA:carnitine CoA-transferase CaiB-like acyl-CoA transferase